MLDKEDYALIQLTAIELTSSASLDRSPKKNWVENAGNLPPYIRKLARAIEKDGHDLSSAIAIAIGRVKDWAKGGDGVDADTQGKATKALAQWEALKAKNAAKKVTLSHREDGSGYLMLSNIASFNTEMVRRAWNAQESEKRKAYRAANPSLSSDNMEAVPYTWIRELWTNFIIVEVEDRAGMDFQKIPYTVKGEVVTFGEPEKVEQVWKDAKGTISQTEKNLLKNIHVAR